MFNEKISVIIPIYNVEKYLKKCIDSVIEQTYSNLEIILIDDGSLDNSSKICDEYGNKDKRIIVIHKPNGGLSDARNYGLNIATGNYYLFIDSDDFILSNTIEEMYKCLIMTNSQISICNMIRIFEDGTISNFYTPVDHITVYEGKERFISLSQPSVCNKLFKSSLFKNIYFPKGKFYEDTFIYHELVYNANKIVFTGKNDYYYLSRKDSILGKPKYSDRYFDFIEAVSKRMIFLLEHNIQPYANDACLSVYAAVANAEKYITKTNKNKKKFENIKVIYAIAFKKLIKLNSINIKQKMRLILLYYFPAIHNKLY